MRKPVYAICEQQNPEDKFSREDAQLLTHNSQPATRVKWNRLVFLKWASSRENLSSGFATRVDSNQAAQLQRLARGLKFRI